MVELVAENMDTLEASTAASIDDAEHLCRLCLKHDENVKDIFEDIQNAESESKSFSGLLYDLLQIKVSV